MDQATAEARALGHRLSAFVVELHSPGITTQITIWSAYCRCRPDAEVFVTEKIRLATGRRRITLHGAAIEEPHGKSIRLVDAAPPSADGRESTTKAAKPGGLPKAPRQRK